MYPEIKTPQTHPDHDVVGQYFVGWTSEVYLCDSYDTSMGFWMTNILDPKDRRNVSERAIGRTFHEKAGQVRPHHPHHADAEYVVVDLDNIDAGVQPFPSAEAAAHADPRRIVFFDSYYGNRFHESLVKAREELRQRQAQEAEKLAASPAA